MVPKKYFLPQLQNLTKGLDVCYVDDFLWACAFLLKDLINIPGLGDF